MSQPPIAIRGNLAGFATDEPESAMDSAGAKGCPSGDPPGWTLLEASVLAPLTGWILGQLIGRSGHLAVSNS